MSSKSSISCMFSERFSCSWLPLTSGQGLWATTQFETVWNCYHGLSRYLFNQYNNMTPAISIYYLLMVVTWFSRPTNPVDWCVSLVNFSFSWSLISILTVMLPSTRKPLAGAKASARAINWLQPQVTDSHYENGLVTFDQKYVTHPEAIRIPSGIRMCHPEWVCMKSVLRIHYP